VNRDLPVPERALAIGAHPDDIEFGCGGTLAKWAAAGCEIHHMVCTDGSKGSWEAGEDLEALVATRKDEQRAASVALGGRGEVIFLGSTDGELEAGLSQRADVCLWIRRIRPQVVLGHDPWKRYRIHPDHRYAGFLVTDGIVAARDPHFFPDQEVEPYRPQTLMLFEADEADHGEDVAGYEDRKIAALLEHKSQLRSTMGIEGGGSDDELTAEISAFAAAIKEKLAADGTRIGAAAAELFKRIDKL
jgi:LmbE family N-acetylglucosaminyl deacetylase